VIHDLDACIPALAAADVVVIGAGPVGILTAVALARQGKRVVLAECGGAKVEQRSQDLNRATVSGRAHTGVHDGRARILGGTSTLWGGQLIPFRAIDFEARPWLELKAWPIRRSDVAPYYEKVSAELCLPLRDDDDSAVWKALGLGKPDLGEDCELIVTKWLKEVNFARIFAEDIERREGLDVVLHACILGFESVDGRIVAAEARSPLGHTMRLCADRFVLACGTIEASRLMLASASANPALPWAGNRWLGVGFQDHLDIVCATVEPIDRRAFGDLFDNIFIHGYKYNPKIALASSVQARDKTTNIAAVMQFSSSLTEHLGYLKTFLRSLRSGLMPENLASLPRHLAALGKIWWPLVRRYLRDNRMFNPADRGIHLRIHCEQIPLDSSRIALDHDMRDANGLPQTRLEWHVDGREIDTIATFTEIVAAELEARGLAKVTIVPAIAARDPAALDGAVDTNHHCGGLRMATGPEEGVVDSDMKVFGTVNFYIAGAATFPSSSFANPTFTALALARRLADHLCGAA
jgi:choline dehydrogenase-like flavoprotein